MKLRESTMTYKRDRLIYGEPRKASQLWVTPNHHLDTSRVRTQHIDHRAYPYKATDFEDSMHTSSTVDVRSLEPPARSFKYKGQKINNLRFVYAIITAKTPIAS